MSTVKIATGVVAAGALALGLIIATPASGAVRMDYPPQPTPTATATPAPTPTPTPTPTVTPTPTPTPTPTVTPTPTPKPPIKFMPNPVRPRPVSTQVILAGSTAAQNAKIYGITCRSVRGDFGTPVVTVSAAAAVKIRFTCKIIPAGTPVTARIFTGGRWVTLGTALASKKHQVVLPALRLAKGTYTVLITTPDGFRSYFTVRAR